MSDKILVAHHGSPFTPPVIPAAGGVVLFYPNPEGGQLWLGEATPEQAEELCAFDFYFVYKGEAKAPDLASLTLPDKSWTRDGIAEWAKEFLGMTIDIKAKAEMLTELEEAIEKATKPAVVPETAPVVVDEPSVAPEPTQEPAAAPVDEPAADTAQ